jgi:hypothetical protein
MQHSPIQFAAPVNLTDANGPTGAAVGDFNNDGHLDIATVDETVPFKQGIGYFKATAAFAFNAVVNQLPLGVGNTLSIVAADFNQDGIPDVAFTDDKGRVWIARGDATNPLAKANMVNFAVNVSAGAIAVGDFNHPPDGWPDIVTGDGANQTISVLVNNKVHPAPGFAPFQTYNTPDKPVVSVATAPGSFGAAGGGLTDIAAALDSNGEVDTWVNSTVLAGVVTFTHSTNVTFGFADGCNSVVTGRFNNTGWLDIAVGLEVSDNFGICTNQGEVVGGIGGTFVGVRNTLTVGLVSYSVANNAIVAADFDGDGIMDLAFAVSSAPIMIVARQAPVGTWTLTKYNLTLLGNGITVGDFNGDGHPDIVVTNTAGANNVQVFHNTCL